MLRTRGHLLVLAVLGILGLAGCSSDPTRPAGPPTDFRGIVVGSEGVGTIEVLIAHPSSAANAGTVPARATLRLRSGFYVRNLEGAFDPSAGSLSLSGSDWSLQGAISSGLLRGDGGTTSGSSVFIAQENDIGASAVADYTGVTEYQGGLAIRDGMVVGATVAPGGMITFTGSFSPADSSLTLLDPANPSGPAIGTGDLRAYVATVATIRFDFGSGRTWTWSGYPWIGYSGP